MKGQTWRAPVQSTYGSIEDLRAYNHFYDIVGRCGFKSVEELWNANPTIGGSVEPREFGLATRYGDNRMKNLGLRLCDWHSGMDDPVYAVGSCMIAGDSRWRNALEGAIENLDKTRSGVFAAYSGKEADDRAKELDGMIRILSHLRYLDEFTYAYIECALWTDEERLLEDFERTEAEKGVPFDPNDSKLPFDASDLSPETLEKIIRDCRSFQDYNDLVGYPLAQAGHDFWLSRNGHGCGFFEVDYGTEEQCEKLQASAQSYGEVCLEVGDDGLIYAI